MRKITLMAAVVAMSVAGPLWACDKEGKIAKADGKIAPCCQAKLKGAVAKVMKTLPSMAYRVDDLETPCFKTATAKAGVESKIQFVVADKTYGAETAANIALAELLEKEIENLKTVQFAVGDKSYHCPISAKAACKNGKKMKYRLAGFDFETRDQVDKALQIINCKLRGCPEDCIKDCLKNFHKGAGAKTAGAKKGCCPKAKAKVASAKDAAYHKGAAATVAAKKGGCPKAKAKVASAKDAHPPCHKGAAATVAAKKGDRPKAKAKVASGEGSPCRKGAATTLAADKKADYCKKAQARLAAVQDQIQLIVETAANVALSS